MIGFNEAQILQWVLPLLWPMLRVLGLFTAAPVLSMRSIPVRVRVGLAGLVALCAQPGMPPMPMVALDSPAALAMVAQQVVIGLTIGFAARVVFTSIEFAGEIIGLQMGLNFASFFDATSGSQVTATARFFNTMAAWLFVVINGHLLLTTVVVESFQRGPVPLRAVDRAAHHHDAGLRQPGARSDFAGGPATADLLDRLRHHHLGRPVRTAVHPADAAVADAGGAGAAAGAVSALSLTGTPCGDPAGSLWR
jgi:hypothetical protein